jgi:hypothetical protein
MKYILFLVVLVIIFSCSGNNDKYFISTDVIEIKQYSLPDTANLFDTIKVGAMAQEPNGCWTNLNFVLSKITDTTYRLKAFGTFENHGGICPSVIVEKDTSIIFIPIKRGNILFYITQPTTAKIDTLFVK